MRNRLLGVPLIRMGEVTSTMDIVRRLDLFGAAEGTTVIAAHQTQGRGRAGRSWQSPQSIGLYCSILLRPRIPLTQFQPFSIAAGLAVCDALDPDERIGLQVKWPNDIVWQGRKLAGLLILTNLLGGKVESANLGVGLNLFPDPDRLDTAIALAELPGDDNRIAEVFPKIVGALSDRYARLCAGDLESALAGWRMRLAFLDRAVSIQDGATQYSGILRGIDSQGALILEENDGRMVTIHAGELTRGPRPAEPIDEEN